MNDIAVINDGALLIHNGVIAEAGPARRIENLLQSRGAKEIDAQGKLVMPAFIDADALLVAPHPSRDVSSPAEIALRVLSRKTLEASAALLAASFARAGVLSLAAHTGFALDLRDTTKVLLIHQSLRNRPLRIRSILSPRAGPGAKDITDKWLAALRRRKLASILELTSPNSADLRGIATAGASAGFSLRLRSAIPLEDSGCQLALDAGAVAIVAPPGESTHWADKLAAIGCVHVLAAIEAFRSRGDISVHTRRHLEQGAAVALASGYTPRNVASFNPQFLLYLATSRFGLTIEEAICATTWNAACSLRLSHVVGSLEPGKSADLLIMDVPDYRDLPRRAGHNDVQLAIRAGHTIYRRAGLILD